MQLQINDRSNRMSDQDHKETERKVLFAISRFSPLLDRVELTITDVNGPRGGVDVQCQCRAIPKRGEPLVVVDCDAEVLPSIGACMKRMGRAVARWVERKNDRKLPSRR